MGLHSFVVRIVLSAARKLGQGRWQTCIPGLLSWLTQESCAEVSFTCGISQHGGTSKPALGCFKGRGLSCWAPIRQNLHSALPQKEALGCAEGRAGNMNCCKYWQA